MRHLTEPEAIRHYRREKAKAKRAGKCVRMNRDERDEVRRSVLPGRKRGAFRFRAPRMLPIDEIPEYLHDARREYERAIHSEYCDPAYVPHHRD